MPTLSPALLVTRAVKRRVWPALKALGFSQFSGRSGWRSRHLFIDVVNLQSAVGKYRTYISLRDGTHASAGSFAVNLGVFIDVQRLLPWAETTTDRPLEWECDYRLHLERQTPEPRNYPQTVWPIAGDAGMVENTVCDAADVILKQGLLWFDKYTDPEAILKEYASLCDRNLVGHPDFCFRSEDRYAGLAIALGRKDQAIAVYRKLAERPEEPGERDGHRKLFRGKIPFWKDEAQRRLNMLLQF
ncbi:MAG: DUF4304 domain-containing protein [Gemmataceae bacterium]